MAHLIKFKKKYDYKRLRRNDGPEGRSYGDRNLPSVTRILDATKDKKMLEEWARQVGEKEAERIKNHASRVGTYMHLVIENAVACKELPCPTDWDMVHGYELGYRLMRETFDAIDEVWGSEVTLHTDRYAGTTDMVGLFKGKSAIIDFKQSIRPKRHEWITDYWHQIAAYIMAHDHLYETEIEMGVIMISVQAGGTQVFTTTGHELSQFKSEWKRRVDKYYRKTESKGNS